MARTRRTPATNTRTQSHRIVRFKDYLVGLFTDNLFYNITDEDGNRIVIYDDTGFEEVTATDWDKENKATTIWTKRI